MNDRPITGSNCIHCGSARLPWIVCDDCGKSQGEAFAKEISDLKQQLEQTERQLSAMTGLYERTEEKLREERARADALAGALGELKDHLLGRPFDKPKAPRGKRENRLGDIWGKVDASLEAHCQAREEG